MRELGVEPHNLSLFLPSFLLRLRLLLHVFIAIEELQGLTYSSYKLNMEVLPRLSAKTFHAEEGVISGEQTKHIRGREVMRKVFFDI